MSSPSHTAYLFMTFLVALNVFLCLDSIIGPNAALNATVAIFLTILLLDMALDRHS